MKIKYIKQYTVNSVGAMIWMHGLQRSLVKYFRGKNETIINIHCSSFLFSLWFFWGSFNIYASYVHIVQVQIKHYYTVLVQCTHEYRAGHALHFTWIRAKNHHTMVLFCFQHVTFFPNCTSGNMLLCIDIWQPKYYTFSW